VLFLTYALAIDHAVGLARVKYWPMARLTRSFPQLFESIEACFKQPNSSFHQNL